MNNAEPRDKDILVDRINKMVTTYYSEYYWNQLGLVDWKERVASRLDEEKNFARPMIEKIENWLGYSFSKKSVLVVGAGTGAECVELVQRGAEVQGIEPNSAGVEILQAKAQLHDLNPDAFRQGVAEELPYEDSAFDFVYCYTVIEHVRDIEKSIDEMIRVCKTGGWVFIQTGDYRFPYEWHYKKERIPFSPKWLTYLHFALLRRPVNFLRSINFVTAPQLDRILMKRNVVILRITPPWLTEWKRAQKPNTSFVRFVERYGIGRDQNIFLRKQAP